MFEIQLFSCQNQWTFKYVFQSLYRSEIGHLSSVSAACLTLRSSYFLAFFSHITITHLRSFSLGLLSSVFFHYSVHKSEPLLSTCCTQLFSCCFSLYKYICLLPSVILLSFHIMWYIFKLWTMKFVKVCIKSHKCTVTCFLTDRNSPTLLVGES